jgi:16S rRNA (guanine527-N7)-methyltransferase
VADSVVLEAISAQAGTWGVAVTPSQVEGIVGFFAEMVRWNARVNLTGASSVEELIGDHLPDSFALARLVPAGARVVDVGAGGGLPGVPFALLRPDCRTTLVEPRAKRCAFLSTAKRMVGGAALLEVARCRHDKLPRQAFGVASSRATFAVAEWVAVGLALVQPGGRVIVFAANQVALPGEACVLADSVEYTTISGVRRWAGAFVPRGTIQSAR